MAIRLSPKGITDSFVLTTLAVPKSCYSLGARTTFDRGARRCSLFPAPQTLATSFRMTSRLVIAVRVSCGHLCGAEAPTEPTGETAARRVAIRSTPLVIASTERCAAIRSFAKGEADSHGRFAEVSAGHPLPRNDKTFCRCINIRRAAIPSFTCHCDRRKACGNPFFPL